MQGLESLILKRSSFVNVNSYYLDTIGLEFIESPIYCNLPLKFTGVQYEESKSYWPNIDWQNLEDALPAVVRSGRDLFMYPVAAELVQFTRKAIRQLGSVREKHRGTFLGLRLPDAENRIRPHIADAVLIEYFLTERQLLEQAKIAPVQRSDFIPAGVVFRD
jgi:hypothetical protein